MKKLNILLIIFLLTGNLFAQRVVFPVVRMNAKQNPKESIKLTELKVDVKLTGNVSVTTYDMIFTSEASKILEGEFEFPLAENQTVAGFALDINGKMRQGVVVEKNKGRQVFEDVVRKSVDPGLLEKTVGNNYKARVYPFNPKSSRHVQIKIQETLTNKNEFCLNPITAEVLPNFSFSFHDFRDSDAQNVVLGNGIVLKTGTAASFEQKDFKWDAPVKVPLKTTKNSQDIFMQTVGTDTYFYSEIPLETKTVLKPQIQNLAVYFDTSLSRKKSDLEKELALLKMYLNKQVKKSVEIIEFSNEIKSVNKFQAKDWGEIEKCIKAFCYDGATNYESAFNYKTKADEILLFSDGLANWGDGKKLMAGCPVSTVSSSLSANYDELKLIARNNKGQFINLQEILPEQGESKLENETLRLVKVSYDGAVFDQVYPVEGTIADGNFSVSGILKKKSGIITLGFGYGNKVEFEKSIEVNAVTGHESDYVEHLWAVKKLEELSLEKENNKKEIIEFAKKYTIVTEETSLIVLETAYDYFRYGITPPEELKKEFEKFSANTGKKSENKGISERVYSKFEEFKNWWNKKPEDFKKKNIRANPEVYYDYDLAESSMDAENVLSSRASMRASEARSVSKNESDWAGSGYNGAAVNQNNDAKIIIQPWNSDVEYLKILKKTPDARMYENYLELRQKYESSPSFYMDVASYFYSENKKIEAVRIISNMAELNLENTDVLRALGNKLMDFGEYQAAAKVFEKLIVLRPEIPQFLRDAANAKEKCKEYQQACDLLYKVVCGNWDLRYDEIQQICLNEMNSIIARNKVNVSSYDKKLLENFPVDIRVVLTWNTDDCDIDLWVIDPDDEKCFYGNKLTNMGGRLSRDFTQGYGPEEFCLKTAKSGKYKIVAHYYGNHQQKILQPVVVQAEVYTNFGKKNQKCQILTLQLENIDGDFTVGEVLF